jgi:hypothetical protein
LIFQKRGKGQKTELALGGKWRARAEMISLENE